MKTDLIFENGNIRYKDKIYEQSQYNQLLSVIGKNIRIIILGEKLFVKNYKVDKKSLNNYIKEVYENEIAYSVDLLMDYKYKKKRKEVYTYTLKKSTHINRIAEKADKLQVMPIQYILKKYVKRKIKNKNNYLIISKVNSLIYVVYIENNTIKDSNTFTLNEILSIKENYFCNLYKSIIIDKSILDEIKLDNYNGEVISMNIGENVYEKICKI